MSLCWCRARASGPIRGRRRDRIVRVGCQRGALCRVARARRLHISDYRLPAIIDVNVLDADILVSALQFDQRALDRRCAPGRARRRRLCRSSGHGRKAGPAGIELAYWFTPLTATILNFAYLIPI